MHDKDALPNAGLLDKVRRREHHFDILRSAGIGKGDANARGCIRLAHGLQGKMNDQPMHGARLYL